MQSQHVPNVHKIAVLRANALGDFIVILPAIHAIRAAYPAAEIVLLGKPWHEHFLSGQRTPVNRVVVIPVSKGIREEPGQTENEAELEAFFAAMQAEQFDIALQFQGKGLSANPFVRRLGARLTVGLTCPEAVALDRSVQFYYYQHEAIRYLEVASLIGATPVVLEPVISLFPQDYEEASQYLSNTADAPFAVLHPCAMDIRRTWPAEKFAQLGDELARQGCGVVLTGSKADTPAIEIIIGKMQYPAINLSGRLTLGGLASVLARSTVVIASDTGPLHLARAVGAATVGIHWAPNLINWGAITRSKHRPAVSWRMECPLCNTVPNDPYPFEPQTGTCQHLVSFVRDVSVAQVVEQVRLLTTEENRFK